jgi:hypothetical protein
MVAANAPVGIYDAALKRRQALMGASGPRALVKNGRVAMIAMFACIGGLLYGELGDQVTGLTNTVQDTTKVSSPAC